MFGIRFQFLTFFVFYVQLLKTSLFPTFFFFQNFSKYKCTLVYFQQPNFSKKLDKLIPKFHAYSTINFFFFKRPKRALTKNVYNFFFFLIFNFLEASSNFEIFLKKICTMPLQEALLYGLMVAFPFFLHIIKKESRTLCNGHLSVFHVLASNDYYSIQNI